MKSAIQILTDRIEYNEQVMKACEKNLPDEKAEVSRIEKLYEDLKLNILDLKYALAKLQD